MPLSKIPTRPISWIASLASVPIKNFAPVRLSDELQIEKELEVF
jgi:hypothetical protein